MQTFCSRRNLVDQRLAVYNCTYIAMVWVLAQPRSNLVAFCMYAVLEPAVTERVGSMANLCDISYVAFYPLSRVELSGEARTNYMSTPLTIVSARLGGRFADLSLCLPQFTLNVENILKIYIDAIKSVKN